MRRLAPALALTACVADVPPMDLSDAHADLARGAYLAEHVAVCISCHSQRDWAYLYAPNTDGKLGAGSGSTQQVETFPEGTVLWTKNLTPTHLGDWSDGEVARAITSGLSRDGTPLFLNMPYDQFTNLPKDDVASVVSYLRTLPPQPDEVPERELPFILGLVVRTMPMAPRTPAQAPEPGTAAYGAWLANIASCVWCHSPVDENAVIIPGQELSGGHAFPVPAPGGGTVYSANLTPDPSGLGAWSKEVFVARLRGVDPATRVPVAPGGFNTPMPWMAFSGMSEADAGAIYDWLRTVPPIQKTVTKHVP